MSEEQPAKASAIATVMADVMLFVAIDLR
jgi:hypothetical protein